MARKKLSSHEIDQVMARIRSEYDHYIVHFQKSSTRKRAFENRWHEVLSKGGDTTLFLGVEIQVVKELLIEAEREAQSHTGVKLAPTKPQSYTDRVIAELQKRIEGYPALGLPDHSELSTDVDKLYGTIDWFSRQVWPSIWTVLKNKDPDPMLVLLDQELPTLVSWQGALPKELAAYVTLYTTGTLPSQVVKAQNRCLLLGAAFFHRCSDRLASALERAPDGWKLSKPKKEELELLRQTLALIRKILDDFRLKHLRPHD